MLIFQIDHVHCLHMTAGIKHQVYCVPESLFHTQVEILLGANCEFDLFPLVYLAAITDVDCSAADDRPPPLSTDCSKVDLAIFAVAVCSPAGTDKSIGRCINAELFQISTHRGKNICSTDYLSKCVNRSSAALADWGIVHSLLHYKWFIKISLTNTWVNYIQGRCCCAFLSCNSVGSLEHLFSISPVFVLAVHTVDRWCVCQSTARCIVTLQPKFDDTLSHGDRWRLICLPTMHWAIIQQIIQRRQGADYQ